MEKKKKKKMTLGQIIKAIIVIIFFIALIFITVKCIGYSIDNNIIKMTLTDENGKITNVTAIHSQCTDDQLKQEKEFIHPVDYLEQNKISAISVKPEEDITLKTQKSLFVKADSSSKDWYMKVYKNNDKLAVSDLDATVNVTTDGYTVDFTSPKEKGKYTYYIIFRYNKGDIEYMFELEVK